MVHGSDIIGDRQPPRGIRNGESAEQYLRKHLLLLHQVGNELSLAGSLDELCRLAVVKGRQLLGYQRIGLWFRVAHSMAMTGSFGVDEQGQIRDERGKSISVCAHSPMGQVLNHQKSLLININCPLRNSMGEVVGRGTHVVAALWDGAKVVGCICMDNLLEPRRSLQATEGEILKLYASTVGHLVNRKRTEVELQKAKDVAEAANRAKSFFMANMSREIRTSMNAIMGFTDLALRSGLTAEQRQYLEIVQARSKDLLALISAIPDLSRIEAERLELKPTQFGIARQTVVDKLPDNAIRATAPARRCPLRVLIVEDDAGSQLLARLLLEELGHQITVATTGKEALRKLSKNDFDLVLMDVHIPEMDGLEAVRQIRNPASPARNHAIPIIAMTASAMKNDEEACLQAGMNSYISKPMLPHELAGAIDKIIT